MPWQNNSGGSGGGGGPWGGGPRNPWGQGSGGGGSGGGGSGGDGGPNLDDLIRRGQQRLRGMPGGPSRNIVGLIAGGLVLLWLATSSYYLVNADEVGVVKRFGEFVRVTQPGINFKLPSPIETVEKPKVTKEQSIDIGGATGDGSENFVLTGDQNIADIAYTVRWRISPAAVDKYLFTLENQEQTITEVAEYAMREAVARTPLTAAIGPQRAQVAADVQKSMQDVLDSYGSGVTITGIFFRKVDPPAAVEQAFKDVSAAQQDAQTYINQANAYSQQLISKAQGDTARFNAVYDQYRLAPEVTRKRLYMETMEQVLTGMDKIVVDTKSGVVPYLPLPEVNRQRAAAGANPS